MFCKRALFLMLLAPLILSGCMAQSRVQAKYMDHEADCRNEAQLRALDFQKTGVTGITADTAAERTYAISAGFSECMTKQGWKVSVPKLPTQVAATPPPSGAPGPGGTVAAAPVTVTTTRVSTAPDNAATTTVTTMTAPPGTQMPMVAPEATPATAKGDKLVVNQTMTSSNPPTQQAPPQVSPVQNATATSSPTQQAQPQVRPVQNAAAPASPIQQAQPQVRPVKNAVEPSPPLAPSAAYNRYVPQPTQGAGRQF